VSPLNEFTRPTEPFVVPWTEDLVFRALHVDPNAPRAEKQAAIDKALGEDGTSVPDQAFAILEKAGWNLEGPVANTRDELDRITQRNRYLTELNLERKFDPHQPRDPHTGEWTKAGGTAGSRPTLFDDLDKDPQWRSWLTSSGLDRKGAGEDQVLHEICKRQGFDAKPQVVSEDELQSRIKNGDTELWRGVTDESYAEQFRTGDYFAGRGIVGNGTYTSTEKDEAVDYTGRAGSVDKQMLHLALRKDAKVIKLDDVIQSASAEDRMSRARKMVAARRAGDKNEGTYQEDMKDLVLDPGRWAALRGYDAIETGQGTGRYAADNFIILNRGALSVAAAR